MRKLIDITGNKYNRLTVLEKTSQKNYNNFTIEDLIPEQLKFLLERKNKESIKNET